jgi:hypothetical protein
MVSRKDMAMRPGLAPEADLLKLLLGQCQRPEISTIWDLKIS